MDPDIARMLVRMNWAERVWVRALAQGAEVLAHQGRFTYECPDTERTVELPYGTVRKWIENRMVVSELGRAYRLGERGRLLVRHLKEEAAKWETV